MDRERPWYRKKKVETRKQRISGNKRNRPGYYKSTSRPDVSARKVKNTVTRPVSSTFKQLKYGAFPGFLSEALSARGGRRSHT